jgi:hypothetical protein
MTSLAELKLLPRDELVALMKTHYAKLFERPMDAGLQAHFFVLAEALHDKAPAKKNGTRRISLVKYAAEPLGGPLGASSGVPLDRPSGAPLGSPLKTYDSSLFFKDTLQLDNYIIVPFPDDPTLKNLYVTINLHTGVIPLDYSKANKVLTNLDDAIDDKQSHSITGGSFKVVKGIVYIQNTGSIEQLILYKLSKTNLRPTNFTFAKRINNNDSSYLNFGRYISIQIEQEDNKYSVLSPDIIDRLETFVKSGEESIDFGRNEKGEKIVLEYTVDEDKQLQFDYNGKKLPIVFFVPFHVLTGFPEIEGYEFYESMNSQFRDTFKLMDDFCSPLKKEIKFAGYVDLPNYTLTVIPDTVVERFTNGENPVLDDQTMYTKNENNYTINDENHQLFKFEQTPLTKENAKYVEKIRNDDPEHIFLVTQLQATSLNETKQCKSFKIVSPNLVSYCLRTAVDNPIKRKFIVEKDEEESKSDAPPSFSEITLRKVEGNLHITFFGKEYKVTFFKPTDLDGNPVEGYEWD